MSIDTQQATIHEIALSRTPELIKSEPVDWTGSPFENNMDIGTYGEQVIKAWAEVEGFIVEPSEDTVFDHRINGRRVEVKTSRVARGHVTHINPRYMFYNVYPHTLDDLYLVAVDPFRVRVYYMDALTAEREVGARHILTLGAKRRARTRLVFEFEVPRA